MLPMCSQASEKERSDNLQVIHPGRHHDQPVDLKPNASVVAPLITDEFEARTVEMLAVSPHHHKRLMCSVEVNVGSKEY